MEKTLRGARFLLKNNRCSGVVAYATRQMLEKLSQTSIIIADGTFKACPEPFEQIYVIFGVFDERKIPLVFAFLEGKTTHHYRRLFEIIKQKIGENFNILNWSPEKIISDFETGLTLAVQTEFPNAVHWGCYFHFTQAIFRRVQNSGLQMAYRRDEQLKMFFRKFMSVGFLPMDEIGGSIVRVLEDQETQSLVRRYIELEDFLRYFYNTWFHTFPQKCGAFFSDPQECARQIIVRAGTVPGIEEMAEKVQIFGWRYVS